MMATKTRTDPTKRKRKPYVFEPLPLKEIQAVLKAARNAEGDSADDLPAEWWIALLFVILDTGCTIDDALSIPLTAFDPERQTLAAGPFVYRIDERTAETLRDLSKLSEANSAGNRSNGKRSGLLFPVPDDGHAAIGTLKATENRLQYFLSEAGSLFRPPRFLQRLAGTGQHDPELISRLRIPQRSKTPRKKRKAGNDDPKNWTLHKLAKVYISTRIGVSDAYAYFIRGALNRFNDYQGRAVKLGDLTEELVTNFLQDRLRERSRATVKRYRDVVLMLWKFAWTKRWVEELYRDIPRINDVRRTPTAWDLADIEKMLKQCDKLKPHKGWTGRHWRALILTMYDTSLRVGCLLRVRREYADLERRTLYVPGELQKGKQDTLHEISEQTTETLAELPETALLFPWPWTNKMGDVQAHFRRKILIPAGLPHGRRDLFHKIRRTSYTHVYAELGLQAATEHAAHTSDLSSRYLDKTKLKKQSVIGAIPRPNA